MLSLHWTWFEYVRSETMGRGWVVPRIWLDLAEKIRFVRSMAYQDEIRKRPLKCKPQAKLFTPPTPCAMQCRTLVSERRRAK